MRVALIHDYLREYGGAERVVEDLHEIFPEAPVYTFYYDPKGLGLHNERIGKWDIRTSFYQKFPLAKKFLSASRIIGPLAFERFDLSEFDVVISSSNHHSAKAVLTKPETLHISYIHTPPKMLYGYTTSYNYKKHWYIKIGAEIANHFLRILDFETAQRPDILVANSINVQKRIKKFYRRDSVIIYPGVDLTKYRQIKKTEGKYFLALNRLMRGKGTEIIVAACTKLNLPLKVVGAGVELENLKKIAGPSVEFAGPVKEEDKAKIYAGAIALIVATEQEDFGMTPPEAMAAGTPVIAARSGGYLETVVKGKTGEFFEVSQDLGESKKYVDERSVNSLVEVLKDFNPKKYKEEDLKRNAEKFSKENFKEQILKLVEKGIKT
jgi:glycosyltransferase involved in cell wall biosynthesis